MGFVIQNHVGGISLPENLLLFGVMSLLGGFEDDLDQRDLDRRRGQGMEKGLEWKKMVLEMEPNAGMEQHIIARSISMMLQ